MFSIERALSKEQIHDAQRVRHKVFVEQDKKFQNVDFPDKRMEIPHDYEADTIILVAYYKKKPVGTISAFAYSKKIGLPIEETIEDVADKFNLKKFIKSRNYDSPLYSCGMLAIDEAYRGATGIAIWLYRFIFETARIDGCNDIIATINYKIEKIIVAIGFTHLVRESWYSEEIGNNIFLMYAKTKDLAETLELRDVPNWCKKEFEQSNNIFLWRNEEIVKKGTPGEEFFLILEGSAKVLSRTANVDFTLATLHQGQTFGEMALFSGERTASVITDYCAAKVLSRTEIMSIIEDEEHSKKLVEILIDRLVEMNKKTRDNFPFTNLFASIFSEKIIKALPSKFFNAGDAICRIGEKDNTAYIVKEGQIGIKVPSSSGEDEIMVSTMTPPSLFGHMVFFNRDRTASVYALTETELYVIKEEVFWKIFNDIESRKNLIKNLLELIAYMNSGISQNPEREIFLEGFKSRLINHFKTKRLQEKITSVDDEISDLILDLPLKTLKEEFGFKKKEFARLLEQLKEKEIIKIEEEAIKSIDEEKIKNFKLSI